MKELLIVLLGVNVASMVSAWVSWMKELNWGEVRDEMQKQRMRPLKIRYDPE